MSALAAIHTGLKALGIVDDDKRDFYQRLTGKRSLTEMSQRDQESVLSELRRLGFKPAAKASHAAGKYAKILQALWIAMWNLGLTPDRTDKALTAFVKRQTKVDHTRFLHDHTDATKVIEALKGWMAREAGVDWHRDRHEPAWRQKPGARIALAQWEMLGRLGVPRVPDNFRDFVEARSLNPLTHMTNREWALIMNTFGERIRAAKGGAS